MNLFPFPTSPGGFRFELAVDPAAASPGDLFLSAGDAGATARLLVADVRAPDDQILEQVVLKLRRSKYRIPHAAGLRGDVNNRTIDESWENERRALLAAPEEVGGLHPAFRSWADHGIFPALAYCSASRQCFHPPCPQCGKPLHTCRDDALLLSSGLKAYSESTSRYLYCYDCCRSGSANPQTLTFWTVAGKSEDAPSARARVRRGDELFADIWPLVEKLRRDELDATLRSNLKECFSEGVDVGELKRDRLLSVSYYDTEVLPLRAGHLSYAEACAILGGASWDDLTKHEWVSAVPPGRRILMEQAHRALSEGRQFFYEDDDSGLFPLECLVLKLHAYRGICRHVAALHRDFGRPHLDLIPEHFAMRVGATDAAVPARWSFQSALLDLGATQPFAEDPSQPGVTAAFRPPLDPDPAYSPAYLREDTFGKSELGHLIIRTSEKVTDSSGRTCARVEVDVMGQALRARRMSHRDLLTMSLPVAGSDAPVTLWGSLRDVTDGGIRVLAMTGPLDAATSSVLEAMTNRVVYDREVIHYRAFHVPVDVYSLGMILFHTLLVHDSQDMTAIVEAHRFVTGKIELTAPRGGTADPVWIQQLVRDHVRNEVRTFNRYSVLYHRARRASNWNAIPADVWEDLLLLAFRMTTSFAGFSFCHYQALFDPTHPDELMNHVLSELDALSDRLWGELFGSQDINRSVLTAIDQILDEAQLPGDAAAAVSTPSSSST